MARPKSISITPQAPDDNGIVESQTSDGSALTLDGNLVSGGVATMTYPAKIGITSAADDSGVTFTVVGTDRLGRSVTETIAGGATAETVTLNSFKTVTSITPDDTTGAVIVGPTNAFDTGWIPMNRYRAERAYNVTLSSGADLTYKLQHTLTHVQTPDFREVDANAFDDATITGDTTSSYADIDYPVTASRLSVSSYVSGTLTLEVVDPRS